MVGFTLRFGLLVLALFLSAFANAAGETLRVKEADVHFLKEIDDGLSSLMAAASKCRSADADVYECLCKEATSLKQLDAALRAALQRKPEWKGRTIDHGGVTLQIPSLEKQVEDVQEQCGA